MMTFLLFAPVSTKWLGWRKDRKSWRDRLGRFCDIYVCTRTSILVRVTCYLLHSVEQLFWKLWTKRDSLSADKAIKLKGVWNCVYINNWRVCQTRVHKSLIGNLTRHSFSLFDRNKTHAQTSKTSESTASLSLAERWTITEIRRQSNSLLTYSLLTDVLPL